MGVDSRHEEYLRAEEWWRRCRDCYEGSDAVKARREEYLPQLSDPSQYEGYIRRALFFNATARTVDGMAGAVLQKGPLVEMPSNLEDHLEDITLAGEPLETFALWLMCEDLLVGRFGILVDVADIEDEDNPPEDLLRPYWGGFYAEDIINWQGKRINGVMTTTRIVLRECYELPDPEDPVFTTNKYIQYRVLELDEKGVYNSSIWRKSDPENNEDKYQEVSRRQPKRRGVPLNFIPFTPVGPMSISFYVEKPPMLDVVDVNLSHYRTSADLEHGRHLVALPTPWLSGIDPPQPGQGQPLGPGVMIYLGAGGNAGMLEFSGSGLGALVTADQEKRKMMAVLGARLLEEQPSSQETLGGFLGRHSGEQATLRTVTQTAEQALTIALRQHVWWMQNEESPNDVNAKVELNKDFFQMKLSPSEMKELTFVLQSGKISYKTFWFLVARGGMTIPGVTAEDEQKQIAKEGGDINPPEPDLPPEPPDEKKDTLDKNKEDLDNPDAEE